MSEDSLLQSRAESDAGMVIVGAGECGCAAAFALRAEGYEGSVTIVGDEKHLPYERPPLSKEALFDENLSPKFVADGCRFDQAKVNVITGVVVEDIDRHAKRVQLSTGGSVPYRKLLIATGASVRRLPAAEDMGRCVYLRTFDDAKVIREFLTPGQQVAVIGAGFIGLELAAVARGRGCSVTVIEMQSQILKRGVPNEIAEAVRALHELRGVRILTGVEILRYQEDPEAAIVCRTRSHEANGTEFVIAASVILAGVGAEPNVSLARKAGLATDNGIAVDGYLQTSDPSIFAAGDCCSFPSKLYGGLRVRLETWRNAQEQGALAASNMLGHAEEHSAVPWFWSDQFDFTLQVAGLTNEGAVIVRRDMGDQGFILFHMAADGRLVAASAMGRGNSVGREVALARMLIAEHAYPSREVLTAPKTKLKMLLSKSI